MQLLWKLFPVACSKVQHRQPCTFALFRSKQKFPQTLGAKNRRNLQRGNELLNSIQFRHPFLSSSSFLCVPSVLDLKFYCTLCSTVFFLRDHSRRFMDSLFCCLHHLNLPVKSTWESMFKFGSFPLSKKRKKDATV